MSISYMHPLLLNQIIVLLSQSLNECFSLDEQAIIGSFLTSLGDMISLNSTYLAYFQSNDNTSDLSANKEDLLEKSLEKLKEELEKIKNNVQN